MSSLTEYHYCVCGHPVNISMIYARAIFKNIEETAVLVLNCSLRMLAKSFLIDPKHSRKEI